MRINKYLAESGVASRRSSEQFVLAGRVKLNGKTVTALSTEVNVENDTVLLDGKKVKPMTKHIYLMLNKPKGYITTTSDEKGRKTVMDLVTEYQRERLFPVGRLDYETEGLLLLTTDGELANRIAHPRHEIPKTYVARVEGELTRQEVETLSRGVTLDDGTVTKRCKVCLLGVENKLSRIEVVITEGKNRQVRRMFAALNRHVVFLKRMAIGELKVGGLTRGTHRPLKAFEIEYLKKL
ncbi:MAG: rRNA pseudouridine synthase [Clostridiales bacterium]|jgi:23S rRNA pseudouridine2605 synthase|nr:rRNA pseudouridine synthase [Clostridiales bacterium]